MSLYTVRCAYNCPPDVPRQHEYRKSTDPLVFGSVKLFSNKPVQLEEEFARQFLQPDFEVCDDTGMILAGPSRGKQNSSADGQIVLATDETIARFDELSVAAAVARANLIPGGEKFKKNEKKQTVVNFLVRAAEAKAAEVAESAAVADDNMTDDEAAAMLPSAADATARAMAGN